MKNRFVTSLCLLILFAIPGVIPLFSQQIDLNARPKRVERERTFDALHYRIDLTLNPVTKSFSGSTTVTLTPLRERLMRVDLDAETFEVGSVHLTNATSLPFSHENGVLRIPLPTAATYGDTLSLTIQYEARDVDIDGTRFGVSGNYEIGIGFIDATDAHPALVNTLSFPEGARHWFPCYDHPNDPATQETIVTVPKDWKALSNGLLVRESVDPARETATYHWFQSLPHATYLASIAAGPFVVVEDSYGSIPVNYWVFPDDEPNALRSFGRTPEILAWLTDYYGVPYPWEKYDQVTVPGIGGGAESTTATLIGLATLHDENGDIDFPSHWLVAHEAAHHWFGDLISYRDWTQTFVAESFATFTEFRWAEYDLGPDEGAWNLLNKKNAYLRETREKYTRPIVFDRWTYPNENFDRHTYEKGAVVLNMLRHHVGETAFRRILQHFLTSNEFHPVDIGDLKRAIKEATGYNLDWFIDQWFLLPGHPVFEVHYALKAERGKLGIQIKQTQDVSDGTPIFRVPINIRVDTSEGSQVHHFWMSSADTVYTVPVDGEVRMVRFDEGNVLLKEWTFEKSTQELLYQLHADDAIGQVWALNELSSRAGENGVRPAVEESARNAVFWSVRERAVRLLSDAYPDESSSFFKKYAADVHSRVRAAAYMAVGKRASLADIDWLKERTEADPSYVSRAGAIRALGQSRHPGVAQWLVRFENMDSPRNVIGNAVRDALKDLE